MTIHVNRGFLGEGHPHELPRCGDTSAAAVARCTADEVAFREHPEACAACLAILTAEHEAALAWIAEREAAQAARMVRAKSRDALKRERT